MSCFNHISRIFLSVVLSVTLCFPVYGAANNPPAIGDVLAVLHHGVFLIGIFGPSSVKRTAQENTTYSGIKDICQQLLSKQVCQEQERCEWLDDRCDLDEELVEIEVRLRNFMGVGWMFVFIGVLGTFMAGAGMPLLGVGIYLIHGAPSAKQLKKQGILNRLKANATETASASK